MLTCGSRRQCKGHSKSGHPCRVAPQLVGASGYCRTHDPSLVDARKLQSLRGGATTARRFKPGITPEDLGPLETPSDAQRWLRTIAQAVGSRHLTHAEGNAMSKAVSEWIKARDLDVREQRLTELERKLKRLQQGGDKPMKVVR